MWKIYIDTSQRYIKKVFLLSDRYVLIDEVVGDIDVVVEISKLLTKHKINPDEIELVEVNKGPGSLTGLKMGVTVANIFNWSLGRKKINELVYPEYGKEPNIQAKA